MNWHANCQPGLRTLSTYNQIKIMAAKKTTAKKTAKKAAKKAAAKPAGEGTAKEPKAAAPAKTAKVAAKAAKSADAAAGPELKAKPKPVAKAATVRVSVDVIARAAYLNYRRRVEQGLPGDSNTDWLEAERQMGGEG
jgi:hypothetical protein